MLGYRRSGFRAALAVDESVHAAVTFTKNHPSVPFHHGDIRRLPGREALLKSGLQVGQLDVLDASPPCRSFSSAGKRDPDDPRIAPLFQVVRFTKAFQPKAVVVENVKGITVGHAKLQFLSLLQRLRNAGYRVDAKILNAMYFGVPQSRERVFIIALREDLMTDPSFPYRKTDPRSVKEALGKSGAFLVRHTYKGNGEASILPSSFTRPAATILRWVDSMPVLIEGKRRKFTTSELKTLQGFPQSYFFGEDQRSRFLIGDAVPPPLAHAVAAHVAKLLSRCRKDQIR